MDAELNKAFERINKVASYSNLEHQKGKIITKTFKGAIKINGGKITMMINFSNFPPKELLNALDELQKLSNELLFEVIPDNITSNA